MSDLIHLYPFTIRCSQRSKQIEALSACPGSLGLFCGFIFAIPAPRGGGFEQLSTAIEMAGFLRSQTDAIDGKTLRGSHVAL